MDKQSAATLEVIRELSEWSGESGRRIGVLVDRRGRVSDVILGDSTHIEIPEDHFRERPAGRFCGLRWIHTGPNTDDPSEKDLTALLRARFDWTLKIAITDDGRPWSVREAYLKPPSLDDPNNKKSFVISPPISPREIRQNFPEFIKNLEDDFEKAAPVSVDTAGYTPERTVLVTVGTGSRRLLERREEELKELVSSAGGMIVGTVFQHRENLHPKTLLGAGRVRDLAMTCVRVNAELVVFSCNLTAAQTRALEEYLGVRVIDRTQVILDLFAQSARSSGGKLQVELARLRYLLPRLVGRGEGLSQIGGGSGNQRAIGSNRGLGEKKLELDRRSIHHRIKVLEDRYKKLVRRRGQKRHKRLRANVDHLALVGYTNAGKSTLFNRLTGATVGTADRLFKTLDPTIRKRVLPSLRRVVFSDTVGFLEDLPNDLIRAFGATLDELRDARVRLHIADASAPDVHLKIKTVRKLLEELELDGAPEILVFNKCDLVNVENYLPLARQFCSDPILISSKTGEGVDKLIERIEGHLQQVVAA